MIDSATIVRIRAAKKLIQEVADELDTETRTCHACGLTKALDYDELQLWRSLSSTARRLEKAEAKVDGFLRARHEEKES